MTSSFFLLQDYIIFNSTIAGYSSFRNQAEGSYFVRLLCRELEENGTKRDLRSLMDTVMENVGLVTGSQQPVIESTFAKKVVLVQAEKVEA